MKEFFQKYIPWTLSLVIIVLFFKSCDVQEYSAHYIQKHHDAHIQEFLTQGTIKI